MSSILNHKPIEEASLNAWPALRRMMLDGWLLRFADGYTRRANSVNPIYLGTADPQAKVRRCEAIYRAAGLPTVFKITPFVHPGQLDALLTGAGYRQEAPTSVQTLDLTDRVFQPKAIQSIQMTGTPTDRWLSAFGQMNNVPPERVPTLTAILHNIVPAVRFALLPHPDDPKLPVACGLGVLDGSYLGLFDIVTHPDHRRRGYSRRLITALLGWAKTNGACTAYLQVMLDNAPARTLYAKLGFREVYQYWYRIKTNT